MTSASTPKLEQRWRRKGNEVVESGRNGRRVFMAVSLCPSDHESLDLAAAAPDMAREIQRLRAAMVYAMDSCESALVLGVNGRALTHVTAARTALKTALEKK